MVFGRTFYARHDSVTIVHFSNQLPDHNFSLPFGPVRLATSVSSMSLRHSRLPSSRPPLK